MNRSVLVLAALMFLPGYAGSQEFTPQQQEVWAFVEGCWDAVLRDNSSALMDCFHEDYTFWWSEDVLPFGKEFVSRIVPINLPIDNLAVIDVRPARIVVKGDVAIVHWGARWFIRSQEGPLEPVVERVAMTLIRENGRWSYLGGAGSPFKD